MEKLIEEKGKSEFVKISVKDTGIGIEKEIQQKIFQRFNQKNNSNTRKFGGVGLGLSIVKLLVRKMKSEILLKSSPGHGTEISFNLYLKLPLDLVDRIPVELKLEKKARVLIAEDVESNQLILAHFLKKSPIELTFVDNGQEAIDRNREDQFDLILMDIQMPEMDGLEAIKVIRKEQVNDFRVPIVALTARTAPEEIQECLDVGADEHMPKPYNKIKIKETINRYLRASQ